MQNEKRKYKLTRRAKSDLDEIGSYTLEQWGKNQAKKYLSQLGSRFKQLAENSNLGKLRRNIRPGYRSYHEGKHVIFYKKTDYGIKIIRVLHHSMDVELHI